MRRLVGTPIRAAPSMTLESNWSPPSSHWAPPPSSPPIFPAVEDVLDRVFRIKDPVFAGIAPRKTSVTKEAHEEEE